ncbi:MAG TPA: hypothetical protein VGJ73_14255 [Verrucomicrobiae bacterium]|jgi:hypothetical protein
MSIKSFSLFGAFAAVLFNCFNLFADPLNNWHWRNPLPSGNPPFPAQVLNGIIFTNGTFFAVGNFGVVATSLDATNWVQISTATSNQLNAIIFADGRFVAVGNSGTIETSADGTNWVLQSSGTTANLDAVACGNGTFVAVGGAILASSDTVNWSPAVSGLSSATAVAGNSTGLVAVNESSQDYFSTDGLHWTANTLTVPVSGYFGESLHAQIVTPFGDGFVIGSFIYVTSESADMFMFTSTDGVHWTTNALGNIFTGTGGFAYSFFIGGTQELIAAGDTDEQPFLQFSSNGVNWSQTNIVLPIGLPFTFGTSGAYGNGAYVMVGQYGNFVATNISSWSVQGYTPRSNIGPTGTCNSIAFSNNMYVAATSQGFIESTIELSYTLETNTPSLNSVITYSNTFVAVGNSGEIYQSTNGLTWTQHNSGTSDSLHCIAASNGLLVAVGENGAIQTSPSGTIWTSRLSGTSLALYGVAYSNGLYVAVGQEGTVVTSPDGINWTVQDSGQLNDLMSITYGSAGFLAVGASGTILTSPDGVNWTQQMSGSSINLETAAFGHGYYLIAGAGPAVFTSPDGINWTSRNIGATGGQTIWGSAFLNERFDVVGSGGTIIESDSVPPLFDIQIHGAPPEHSFTVFITPGNTFRIQSCTSLAASQWSTIATFNNAPAITQWTNTSPESNPTFFRAISP